MQNYLSLQDTHDHEEQGILFHAPEPTRSRWNHIEDLDSFFTRIYRYHQSHGFLCMVLSEILELNQYIFVVFLTTYLVHGIDYATLFQYNNPAKTKVSLSQVVLPIADVIGDFTFLSWFFLAIAAIVWLFKFLSKTYHLVCFWDIKQFYNTILGIDDGEVDNLTWNEVQGKIIEVQLEQQMCIHKRELTELDIYHRILRQENYMVAMVNKRLIPPRTCVPFVGDIVYWTKGLRYNVQGLIFWSPWSLFENPWQLKDEYKRYNLRHELANKLGKQILWLAVINIAFAPVILVWYLLNTFFKYAELIRREPGKIGIRKWSLYGKMYVRHFNELSHELNARLSRAYRPATKYLGSFNSPVISIIATHVGFLCGALFAVIIALTVYDEDVIGVEHVITLMTGLGAMIAVCRGLVPDDSMVWCPEALLEGVVMQTHYLPRNWKGQAHTSNIKEEFQKIFQYRFVALLEDLLSPVMTPYFLITWVYPRALDIVDFYRHFTVSVVGVGDVCSFAQMDIAKHGNPDWLDERSLEMFSAPDQYSQAEDGKVEMSLVHFTATNPTWIPPPESQQFVDSLQDEADAYPYDEDSDAVLFDSFQNLLDSSSLPDFPMKSTPDFRKSLYEVRKTMQKKRKDSLRRNSQKEVEKDPTLSLDDDTRTSASSKRLRKSVFIPEDPVFTVAPKKSVWMAEGPDHLTPYQMTSSAVTLHDRFHLRQNMRRRSSVGETSPLLSNTTSRQSK